MKEKYLTLEQNTCAARIFLNTFGFILEDAQEINEFSKIKIYDKSMNEVGQLYFDNRKVMMTAKDNNKCLMASYDIAKLFRLIDTECDNALFAKWSSKINFQIKNNNDYNINGEFLIDNVADSQFGISCQCHPLININLSNKADINLKLLRNGCVFFFEFDTENYNETIEFNIISEYIRHVIKKGKLNQEGYCSYKKYIGIFNAAEAGENKDKLLVFLTEEQNEEILNYKSELVHKADSNDYMKMNIQRGLLMQKLDNDMLEKIQLLRQILTIDGVSILDNLISICYDNYTDEELVALLGTKRPAVVYQNGAENLTNSYFGIGTKNKFLSL